MLRTLLQDLTLDPVPFGFTVTQLGCDPRKRQRSGLNTPKLIFPYATISGDEF